MKNIFDYFRFPAKKTSANIATERLQIIVSHERARRNSATPDYLPMLQRELIDVIAKYVAIDKEQVKVELDRSGNCVNLTLDITLPALVTAEE